MAFDKSGLDPVVADADETEISDLAQGLEKAGKGLDVGWKVKVKQGIV